MKAFLLSVLRKLAYLSATVIIFAAIMIGVTRVVSPILEGHRQEVETWASRLLHSPVNIRHITLAWYQYQPEVTLDDVTLINKATQKPSLQIQKIRVFFSIPQSIWQRKPVLNGVMLSGTSINVLENEKKEYTIRGLPSLPSGPQIDGSESKFNDVINWLSNQPRLVLTNVDVHYTGFNKQNRYITIYNLSLVNKGTKHNILGHAVLHQKIPTEINTAVQWYGEEFDVEKIKAKVYLYISGLSLPQWSQGFTYKDWQINNGIVSAKMWGTWENNAFQKIQTNLEAYNLAVSNQKNKFEQRVYRLSGNLGWKRDGNKMVLAGDDILIDFPKHLWPVTNFYLSLTPTETGVYQPQQLKIGFANLQDVLPLISAIPDLVPNDTLQTLTQLKLKGDIENLNVKFAPNWADLLQADLSTDFHHLNIASIKQLPAVKNFSGSLQWQQTQGTVNLKTERAKFDYAKLFNAPIKINSLSGQIAISHLSDDWRLNTSNLELSNEQLTFSTKGSLDVAKDGKVLSDLTATFNLPDAKRLLNYLPMKSFDPELRNWLNQAILAGSIQSGEAILKGDLSQFPFADNQGLFQVSGSLQKVNLKFAPDWPALENTTAQLTLKNNGMFTDIASTQLADIPFKAVHAEINDFSEKPSSILTIQNDGIQSNLTQALALIHHSSLEKSLGKLFAGIKMDGPFKLDLSLRIPLEKPEATEVKGNLLTHDASINLESEKLILEQVNGQLQFTQNGAQANNLQGLLFNKPFTLDLTTIKKDKNTNISTIRASFKNQITVADLEQWLKVSFAKYAEGSANLTGQIDFTEGAPVQMRLASDLVGMKINLPDQFGKEALISRPFSADIIAEDQQPLKIKLFYDKLLTTALVLSNHQNGTQLSAVNLNLGTGKTDWPTESGLYITGNFDRLDWDKIKDYLNDAKESANGGDGNNKMQSLPLPLRNINIYTKLLTLSGQNFPNMRVELTPTKDNWNVKLTSPDIVGEVAVPTKFNKDELITAQFQKIRLNVPTDGAKTNFDIAVKSLPSILFNANQVTINGIDLGQISFNTASGVDGLTINSLKIQSPRMKLQARGAWIQEGKSYSTHLQGLLKSPKVSDLLKSFGFNVTNFVATSGEVNFNLNWDEAPYAVSVANLNGNASLKLGQGRIVDLGKDSNAKMDIAKMLSIFSLQSIPRRLSLDFSDLSQKGYSFDTMKGDINFKDANVYTSNFRIEGPAAGIGISGRIGFENKDYNLNLNVTPYVAPSLPLGATLLLTGQPLVALAALAINPVITKATTHHYIVVGPWNKPTWRTAS